MRLYFGFQKSSSENRNGPSVPQGPTSGRQQWFQDTRPSMTLQWEGWAEEIPSCPVCGTVASKCLDCSLGTPACWGSFQHWSCNAYRLWIFQMQWHQKLTELTQRPSLGGGKKPSRQASRVNSCCWRLCQAGTMCHQHGSSLVRHSFLSSWEERNCNPCSTWAALSVCSSPFHSLHHHWHLQI